MQSSQLYWIVWLTVMTSLAYADHPKVTLMMKNQKEAVYMDENVTLECSIESDLPNWKYRWYKRYLGIWREMYGITEDTYTLQRVLSTDSGEYWCAAVRDEHPYYLELSNNVTLTVQDEPKAALKIRKPIHIGDNVILDCSTGGSLTGWTYTWYKLNWEGDSDLLNGTTGDTYTVQSVTQSNTGVYWCIGNRRLLPYFSKPSNAVTLSFQEKLKLKLRMKNQKEQIYEGDDVTLECRIEGGLPGWRYRWFKTWSNKWKEITGITGDTYTLKSVSSSDSREYLCWAVRDDPHDYSEVSNAMTLNVQEELKATVKMRNERKPVYIGDSVTLECNIEGGLTSTKYTWRKAFWWTNLHHISGNTVTIHNVTQSDSGAYWCYGSLPVSYLSDVLLLTVQAPQKVTLKIKNPKVQFYTGDDVTLVCSSHGDLSGWTYRWYHWSQAGMWNELKNTTENTYTLQSVVRSDSGKYWCYAFTDDPLHYTEFSNAVTLTVKENPKVTLKIKDEKEIIYIEDNVTLECSIESDLPNWRYRWYQRYLGLWGYFSDITERTYTLQRVLRQYSGEYWCAAVRGDHPYYFELSNPVTLTVQDKLKTTLKMKRPVHVGDTLTLKCSIEGSFTDWTYKWYKLNWAGGSDLLKGTTGDTYTVQSVTQSDTGVYWCVGDKDVLPYFSEPSNAVTLTFQEKLNVTLKLRTQKELIYEEGNVTLECRIEGALPGWRYRWFISWANTWKEITGITGDTYTMKSVSSSDSGEYWCWAVRDDPPDYSEVSNAVTVKAPDGLKATVKMKNERKPVYIGDNVTLECNIDGGLTSTKYKWEKEIRWTDLRRVSGNTLTVQSVTQSDSGAYWCYGSSPVSYLSDVLLMTVQANRNTQQRSACQQG
ncbi:basement membrane-specific heparan sulfate proteoglycan core protein-like isoform X2 [Polypterus senegalus]|uniref:basement membrane-specific heparan sulfate proteoglycan core protein-like isoform X2 n=1 Tax=Polypterus senegalus TaxID=55291 RepID=UPI0019664704|nr:basement membrane-specific heparan sulfate proteoglycan core protein-like isoform X2 [Polypterus senegalus]